MSDYNEPVEKLDEKTLAQTRALNSLKEEIEAVNWYNQRIDATKDEGLNKILTHNMKEEMEHASMTIEWLRRNIDGWEKQLKDYLFTEDEIAH